MTTEQLQDGCSLSIGHTDILRHGLVNLMADAYRSNVNISSLKALAGHMMLCVGYVKLKRLMPYGKARWRDNF